LPDDIFKYGLIPYFDVYDVIHILKSCKYLYTTMNRIYKDDIKNKFVKMEWVIKNNKYMCEYNINNITNLREGRYSKCNLKLLEECCYKYGKKDGNERHYDENVLINKIVPYKNGKIHGILHCWNNGLHYIDPYKDDKKHGLCQIFKLSCDGKNIKIMEGRYIDGKAHGIHQHWNEKGLRQLWFECRDGKVNGKYITYYNNLECEVKKKEYSYVNDIRDGECIKYNILPVWNDVLGIQEYKEVKRQSNYYSYGKLDKKIKYEVPKNSYTYK
ncbi:MORN-repeat protein, partial [Orpheovirus IHUMI-LCC2]